MITQPSSNSEESKSNSVTRELKFASFISFSVCNRKAKQGTTGNSCGLEQCG